jgi:hypothetical protein
MPNHPARFSNDMPPVRWFTVQDGPAWASACPAVAGAGGEQFLTIIAQNNIAQFLLPTQLLHDTFSRSRETWT